MTWHQHKGLVTRYTHEKHESLNSYQSKDMANVSFFVDKQMDGLAKNYMPLIYQCTGIKSCTMFYQPFTS